MPPDVKGTLGSLLRTTLEQVGLVKEAVERQAKSQKVWIDSALLHRKHREALTTLGVVVHELAASGELGDLEDFPEIAEQLAVLVELERSIAEASERQRQATDNARQAAERFVQRATWPATHVRRRVWQQPEAATAEPSAADYAAWQAAMDEDPFDDDPYDDQPLPPPTAGPARKPRRPRPGGGGIAYAEDGLAPEPAAPDPAPTPATPAEGPGKPDPEPG